MEKTIKNRQYIIAILLLLCIVGAFHSIMYSSDIIDDAYITFRYANNLAAGNGLTYNPPEQLEGYTNFLLVVILALGVKVGISPPLLSQLLGISSFLILILLLFRFEEEQNGKSRAEYGKSLIKNLSIKLTKDFGKGFSIDNLKNMRRFYLAFSKSETLSNQFKLTWSHYIFLTRREILPVLPRNTIYNQL